MENGGTLKMLILLLKIIKFVFQMVFVSPALAGKLHRNHFVRCCCLLSVVCCLL